MEQKEDKGREVSCKKDSGTWHATGQSKEKGKMNHPCDGRAWKYFDMIKPEFSGDARNAKTQSRCHAHRKERA
ncbi:hypothetical protein Tco_0913721 [Tanacetum coccineum]